MTPTLASPENNLEALQVVRREFVGSGLLGRSPSGPGSADAVVAAPAQGRVASVDGSRPTLFWRRRVWLPARGGCDVTATVISREESLEALQVVRREFVGSGLLGRSPSGPGSTDAVAAAPAQGRVDGTDGLRLTAVTSPGEGACRFEPPEAAP
ncbi:MAG: hypothetical protein QOF58_877 [Pseudonocardiales bacterium]|nr:hypothetical protein [Pseudonocardiales bacterium]